MMKLKQAAAIFLLYFLTISNALSMPTVKVTLKVVDEAGVPIDGAKAGVNFATGTSGHSDSGVTDADGLLTLSGSSTRFISYGAKKEGYYGSTYRKDYNEVTGITGFRHWEPWNETLVIELRKIKNPRALYIGDRRPGGGKYVDIPGLNKEYGYDLVVGDWVVPDGQGTHRDFVFKLTGKRVGRRAFDATLALSFSNEGDGIQKYDADPVYSSRLRLPHEAPLDGYKNELVQRKARTDTQFIANDFPENRNYFFRIRTQKDDKGNIKSALYGKIYGNISVSVDRTTTMLYYLNPDSNDRNLESDYKKNLFPSKQRYGYTEYPP